MGGRCRARVGYRNVPHKLCKCLYDLCVRFNSYCDSLEVGIAGETKLLLCEATEVVMEKCFQLLGITGILILQGKMASRVIGINKILASIRNTEPQVNTYEVLYDGWGLPAEPDLGTVALFDCDWDDQIDVTNHEQLYLGNPSSSHLIPLSSSMEISTELYATTVRNDALFVLSKLDVETDFAYFWKMEADTRCDVAALNGKDGDVRMYYILL
ncbi:hypothetical protein OROMI_009506 [Orobanche minor]